jgi:hypothetical protein
MTISLLNNDHSMTIPYETVRMTVQNTKIGQNLLFWLDLVPGTKYEISENRIRSNLFAQIILKTNELIKKKILILINLLKY